MKKILSIISLVMLLIAGSAQAGGYPADSGAAGPGVSTAAVVGSVVGIVLIGGIVAIATSGT